VEELKPLIAELSPKLNAYFRSVDRAVNMAKKTKFQAQSTKLK